MSVPTKQKEFENLKVIEIGFDPFLKRTFPDQIEFIDTRIRWQNVRNYGRANRSPIESINAVVKLAKKLLRLSLFQNFDVIVCRSLGPIDSLGGSGVKRYVLSLMGIIFRNVILWMVRGSRVKLVVVDWNDELTIHERDALFLRRADLFFKRELASNYLTSFEQIVPHKSCIGNLKTSKLGSIFLEKVRPIALGIDGSAISAPVKAKAKTWDLFFAGSNDNLPVRAQLGPVLSALSQRGWRIFSPTERLSPDDFQNAIRSSRFCLSPSGAGWDCYRHYEIVAFGSIPICNFRTIHTFSPMRHGIECFYYDPQDDMTRAMESILKISDDQLNTMNDAAQVHLRNNHTFNALAKYMMREICQKFSEKTPRPSFS